MEEDQDSIWISASNGLLAEINKHTGTIASLDRDGMSLMEKGPMLNVWRAPTDNDHRILEPEWLQSGLRYLQHQIRSVKGQRKNGAAIVKVNAYSAGAQRSFMENNVGFDMEYVYTFLPDGSFRLDVAGKALNVDPGKLRSLPRFGVELQLPGNMEGVQWYGLGPGESYQDSKEAQRIGYYKAGVDALMTNYTFPQDNGNRSEVRRVAFHDIHSAGLIVIPDAPFNFSAHRYSPEQFTVAKHPYELEAGENIYVHLDAAVSGLGSNSCGPLTAEKYLVKPGTVKFGMRFRTAAPGELDERSFFEF